MSEQWYDRTYPSRTWLIWVWGCLAATIGIAWWAIQSRSPTLGLAAVLIFVDAVIMWLNWLTARDRERYDTMRMDAWR